VRVTVDAVRRPLGAVVLVTVTLLCVAASAWADRTGGASATGEVVVLRGDRGEAVKRIQTALGVEADGVFGPLTEQAVQRFQRNEGLAPDGVVGPLTRAALGLEPFSRASIRSPVSVPSVLRRIAQCESGGNPQAVSPGGRYRGKYQFSLATWRALGGTGDPAEAPEWVQDKMALKLYRRSGTTHWPNCRRR
jgi:peptidoglycan hydrolase-like protein with peptidoglycan-binding domain